ncbi:MAG: NAD-dependent epimerase/dehydratase family protein [Eubacteriales bacterium]|jgi:GDP-L-fucose synthase
MSNIFSRKKILISGGSGMVGHALSEMLIEQGASVRVVSLDNPDRAPKGTEFVKADLMSLENCIKLCEGMDYVFNLTGVKGSQITCKERPGLYFERSVVLAMNMLRAVRVNNIERYLFTSSYSVYAPSAVFNEDDVWKTFPSNNDWGNAWGKRVGELHIEAYKRELKLNNICIVRPSSVFGPYDIFSSDGMVVSALIQRAVTGQNPLVVWGDGTAVRDFIYSKDLARGMMIMIEKMPEKPVNLGNGKGTSIKELAELIVKYVDPSIELVFDTTKPSGDPKRVMNTERAVSYGFKPEISMDDAIRETVEWYKANRENAGNRYNIFNEKL